MDVGFLHIDITVRVITDVPIPSIIVGIVVILVFL